MQRLSYVSRTNRMEVFFIEKWFASTQPKSHYFLKTERNRKMEKVIYITEEIAKSLPENTLSTLERDNETTATVHGDSIEWLTVDQMSELESKLGYAFDNKTLLTQAFTHSSCRPSQNNSDKMDNETLEFIGDRSIDLLVTKKLISRYGKPLFTDEEAEKNVNYFNPLSVQIGEGELTRLKTQLVNTQALSKQATELELHNYLITGDTDINGELKNRDSVRENLFEALMGAVTVDCGWDMTAVEAVFDRIYNVTALMEDDIENTNYVGLLQEYMQKNYGIVPEYEYVDLIDFEDANFMCELRIPRSAFPDALPEGANPDDENVAIIASGLTKFESRNYAAQSAYKIINEPEVKRHLYKKIVGIPTPDRAVNQLQELWQKNMIGCPEYTFAPNSNFPDTSWECTCYISDKGSFTVLTADKKTAKKQAAYFALCSINDIKPESGVPDTMDALEYKASDDTDDEYTDIMKELNTDKANVMQKIHSIQCHNAELQDEIKTFIKAKKTPETMTKIAALEEKFCANMNTLRTLRNTLGEIDEDIDDTNRRFGITVAKETDNLPEAEIEVDIPLGIIDAVGEPNLDRAVNQLQELWQKGIIGQPTYEYAETVTDVSLWKVTCRLPDGAESSAEATGKQAAKKQAAYKLYSLLIGR